MQLNPINYLHHASKFCSGYDNYLEKRKTGSIVVFNWSYFFLVFTWLIHHRMYKEFIVFSYYLFFISYLLEKSIISVNVAGFILVASHIFISFFTYRIYENHLDMNLKLNSSDIYKRVKPFNFIFSLIITISGIVLVMSLYQFTILSILKLLSFL